MADMDKFYENMDKYNFLAPNVSFPGYFWLSPMENSTYNPKQDPLTMNAKIENRKNLYQEFVKDYYFKGIARTDLKIMDTKSLYHPLIRSTQDKNGKRVLKFDYILVANNLSNVFLRKQISIKKTEQLGNYECLEYIRKRLEDIKIKELFLELKGKKARKYGIYKKVSNIPMNQSTYNQLIKLITSYIRTLKNFQKNDAQYPIINIDRFRSCFDIDKLYLLIAKFILQSESENYEKKKETTALYSQLKFYISNVLHNADNSYNPSIKWYDNKRGTTKYRLENLKREVFEFEKRINKDKYENLTYDDLVKYDLLSNVLADDFMSTINSDDFATLQMSWTFIPSGSIHKEETENNIVSNDNEKTIAKKELKNDAIYHKIILDKTNYKCKIVGKEKFAGYIGYIYDNGIVAFEKLYENDMKHFSKSSNATYIMRFTNFAKFTKLNKQEIINYIKNTANPEVRRFYHSSSWKEKILRYLEGIEYNDEINALIDAFIESQQEYKLKLN